MKHVSLIIGSALLCLPFEAMAQGEGDLVFQDSFETCMEGNRVRWNGQGDGLSWWDPENWLGNQVPAENDAVWISDAGDITVTFGGSQANVNIFCLLSNEAISVTNGSLNITEISFINGDLTLTGGTVGIVRLLRVSGSVQHSGGILTGAGTVTVEGFYNWTGGTQSGAGETVATGGLALSGSAHKSQNERTVTLGGVSTFAGGGNWRVLNAATINNNVSLDIQTNAFFDHRSGTHSTFNNNGALTRSTAAGTTTFEANFNSFGSVGVRIAEGSFDSFTITQAVTLSGTLNISLVGGYQPTPPASFQVMSFDTRTGTFNIVNGVSIGNGNKFDPVYGTTDLTLEVVPE